MVSIVIPAHNEEKTITRSLKAVIEGNSRENLQIIVVCNGCRDQTAAAARQVSERVTVIETEIPSKVNALNLGDEVARGYPRLYMDADVVLTPKDLDEIVNAFANPQVLAASPRAQMDFTKSNWAVRAYYRVWLSLPYTRTGMMGAGVYAISETGRKRFKQFPNIIADDGYIRVLFKSGERIFVPAAKSIVSAPATLRDLIKIKSRSRLGGYQLAARFPELHQNDEKNYGNALRDVLSSPSLWLSIPVYLYVNLVSRRRAREQMKKIDKYVWERDESSR